MVSLYVSQIVRNDDPFPERDSPVLQISLLGPPEVRWRGQILAIPRRQTRALLYYLAADPEPIPREQLCLTFWAEQTTSLARRHLTRLLTHLRSVLPDPQTLICEEDQVGLDQSRVYTDLVEFERLTANGSLAGKSTRALQAAARLYRKPFLFGFVMAGNAEFETWVRQQQQDCERVVLDTLAALIETCARAGQIEEAIQFARRYLDLDELAEDIHRKLIELYTISGNRGAAIRQYEQCITILERELGVTPLPETRAVYQSTLLGNVQVIRQPPQSPLPTLPCIDVPFVGRREAIEKLTQEFARVRLGQGRFVCVRGEPGIGKTRLVQNFAALIQAEAVILTSHAGAESNPIAFKPVVQALRPTLENRAFLAKVAPTWLAEASRLFPELADLQPKVHAPVQAKPLQERARLFEGLCQILKTLAGASQALVLCLDDIQWYDSASLEWLTYLAESMEYSRLMVIATCASTEARPIAALHRQLWKLGVLEEIPLAGLGETEIIEIIHYLIGPAPGAQRLAAQLLQVTDGNPFFLLEILRELLDSSRLLDGLPDLQNLVLPDSVIQAVESHLDHLSPVGRQVLEAGAVLAAPFSLGELFQVTGRSELETADALDELVAHQLLISEGEGFNFFHKIVARVVYASLNPWRLKLLHQRAAQASLILHPDGAGAQLWHFE